MIATGTGFSVAVWLSPFVTVTETSSVSGVTIGTSLLCFTFTTSSVAVSDSTVQSHSVADAVSVTVALLKWVPRMWKRLCLGPFLFRTIPTLVIVGAGSVRILSGGHLPEGGLFVFVFAIVWAPGTWDGVRNRIGCTAAPGQEQRPSDAVRSQR